MDDVERRSALPDFFHLIGKKVGSVRHHRGWLSRGFLRRFLFRRRSGRPHGQPRLERKEEHVRDEYKGDYQKVARRDPFVKEDDRGHTEQDSHKQDDAPVRPQRPDAGASSNEPDESLANLTSRMPPKMSNASWAEVRPFRCDPVTTERAEVCVMRWLIAASSSIVPKGTHEPFRRFATTKPWVCQHGEAIIRRPHECSWVKT